MPFRLLSAPSLILHDLPSDFVRSALTFDLTARSRQANGSYHLFECDRAVTSGVAFVNSCGHGQEFITVPDTAGMWWFVPIIREAS